MSGQQVSKNSPGEAFKGFLIFVVIVVIAVVAFKSCGSDAPTKSAQSAAPVAGSQVASVAPVSTTPSVAVNPNASACARADDIIVSQVKPAFGKYDADNNEFDKHLSKALSSASTKLFALEDDSSGATASAIRGEAEGLIGVSVAIDDGDDNGLGTAANAASTALARLRGVCHF